MLILNEFLQSKNCKRLEELANDRNEKISNSLNDTLSNYWNQSLEPKETFQKKTAFSATCRDAFAVYSGSQRVEGNQETTGRLNVGCSVVSYLLGGSEALHSPGNFKIKTLIYGNRSH